MEVISGWTNCKSRNGRSGDGMRGMMGTWGIRVGMRGIRGGMMGKRGTGGGNEGNKGDNLRVGVELMNYNCGEGQK